MPKSKEMTYSEIPAETNLISTPATKLPTNGIKHKSNGPTNSSRQYAAIHWGLGYLSVVHVSCGRTYVSQSAGKFNDPFPKPVSLSGSVRNRNCYDSLSFT